MCVCVCDGGPAAISQGPEMGHLKSVLSEVCECVMCSLHEFVCECDTTSEVVTSLKLFNMTLTQTKLKKNDHGNLTFKLRVYKG